MKNYLKCLKMAVLCICAASNVLAAKNSPDFIVAFGNAMTNLQVHKDATFGSLLKRLYIARAPDYIVNGENYGPTIAVILNELSRLYTQKKIEIKIDGIKVEPGCLVQMHVKKMLETAEANDLIDNFKNKPDTMPADYPAYEFPEIIIPGMDANDLTNLNKYISTIHTIMFDNCMGNDCILSHVTHYVENQDVVSKKYNLNAIDYEYVKNLSRLIEKDAELSGNTFMVDIYWNSLMRPQLYNQMKTIMADTKTKLGAVNALVNAAKVINTMNPKLIQELMGKPNAKETMTLCQNALKKLADALPVQQNFGFAQKRVQQQENNNQ
jgi:hypothetical protein